MCKLMHSVRRRMKSLSNSGALSMGAFSCSIDTNPLAILRKL